MKACLPWSPSKTILSGNIIFLKFVESSEDHIKRETAQKLHINNNKKK